VSSATMYILIFVSALILAAGSTPLLRQLALRLGIVDRPAARKIHSSPIPLLGGLAIYAAFLVTLIIFGNQFNLTQLVSIILGATLVSFMGLWDDRRSLPAWIKLLGQVLAAAVLLLSDVSITLFNWPILNWGVTLLWVVGITNAMNLLDNMDGLSAGVAAIAAGFILLLAAGSGQYLVGSLAAALLGACIGFLLYNLNPAQIFMGDSGSLFIGFMLAALSIKLRFPNHITAVTWMIPVLVLGLPIFDTSLVIISRLRRGQNPLTTPGKDHISHRLAARGLTHHETVLTLYLVAGLLGGSALFIVTAGVLESYLVGGAVVSLGLYYLWRFEWRKTPASIRTPDSADENSTPIEPEGKPL
jgi:UDP-GlcNAc:undecaprenyl-phosphate/decaprenyl-phosphate GlcNAc-1-phosphate transferase